MQRKWTTAVAIGLALLVLGGWPTLSHAQQPPNISGAELTTHILIPWFEAGPLGAPATNTLFGITNVNRSATATVISDIDGDGDGDFVSIDVIGVHVRLWNVNSIEACDICLPITREDIYVDDIAGLVANFCNAPSAIALLDPDGDGLLKGYATVETTLLGQGNECGAPLTAAQVDPGLVFGQIYHVQLADGQTDGIAAPGFFDPVDVGGLRAFPLPSGQSLFVRFLTGLGNPIPDPAAVFTRLVVWSATSGNCSSVPDSVCLFGTVSNLASIRLCDDEEDCISLPKPFLPLEVNFYLVDNTLPVTFDTPSGWFELRGISTTGAPLHLLAYSFQETSANSSVIFPVPRDLAPNFVLP